MKKNQINPKPNNNPKIEEDASRKAEREREFLEMLRNLPYDTGRIGQRFSVPFTAYPKKEKTEDHDI